MSNIEITNNSCVDVVYKSPVFQDEVITTTGAATIKAGTILARLTATQKLVVFVKGGSGGAEIPLAVLREELTVAGAGDHAIRAIESGELRFNKLIIDADADNSNVDNIVRDGLRDYGLIVRDTQELSELDNQ